MPCTVTSGIHFVGVIMMVITASITCCSETLLYAEMKR